MKRLLVVALALALVPAANLSLRAQAPATAQKAAAGPAFTPAQRAQLKTAVDRGAAYLKSQLKSDGTFDANPGITGMAATALLRQPGVAKADALKTTAKSLAYLRKLAKPDGGIYDKDIPHYITAVSIMAFAAAGQPEDKALMQKGARYLADHLLDEGEGVTPGDKLYGGMGYGPPGGGPAQADIISLEYGLRAMKEAGLAANDPAWDKAIKFLQRTQNNSETNDQKWAANDGGFVYAPGSSQVANTTRSYGAASYAGLMSYAWSNVKKNDDRVQSVFKWIRANYTVDENPGLGNKTLYYYYMVFAKALQAMGEDVIVDSKGQRHNWRADLAKKLVTLQSRDGSWVNSDPAELQNNPVLVTSFTLMAAEAILE